MSALHISLAAEPVFHIGSFAVTNSMLLSIIGSVLLCGLLIHAARKISLHPGGMLTQIVEAASEVLLSMIEQVTLRRDRALEYFPLLMTLFLFILANNWLGLLPGVGTITVQSDHGTVPLLRGATADLNTTLALAFLSVAMTQVFAIKRLGLFGHLKKYISINPVLLFVGILELISEFSKMISFSFRLFGNIFAGEVLLVVIGFLAPVIAPLPFFALELFVGFVQALVFTALTLVFLEIATAEHDGPPDHSHSAVAATKKAVHEIEALDFSSS